MAASDGWRDSGRQPLDRPRPGPLPRLVRATWGSLLRRTVIVFLVAYAFTGPAIYLVYWDQVRAYGTTLALGHASAARGGVARLMLDVADQRSAVDRDLATADTTAAADYAAAQQEAATDLHAIAGDVAGSPALRRRPGGGSLRRPQRRGRGAGEGPLQLADRRERAARGRRGA